MTKTKTSTKKAPPSTDTVHYSVPPPLDGKSYSKRETVDILTTVKGRERAKLIAHWIEKGLIPVHRQQIYALLKQVADGETIMWSKPWHHRGRNPKVVSDIDKMGESIEKMAKHLQIMASSCHNTFELVTIIRREIATMNKEIDEMRTLTTSVKTQMKLQKSNNNNNNSGAGGGTKQTEPTLKLLKTLPVRKKRPAPKASAQKQSTSPGHNKKRSINNTDDGDNKNIDDTSNKNDSTTTTSSNKRARITLSSTGLSDMIACGVQLPSNGSEYTRRETVDILRRYKGKERSRLIEHWCANGLVPVVRTQIYALLKQVQDGNVVVLERPWHKRGRNPKALATVQASVNAYVT